MNVQTIIAGLLLLGCSSAAVAVAPNCAPTLGKAWIRAAPPGATVLAGYAIVRNPCAEAVAITDASSSDFMMGMIHETLVENGVSQMRHVDSIALPAGGEIRFAPGGRHLMLMHPKRQLKVGGRVKVKLKLADGRLIGADFIVAKGAPK